MPYIDIKQNKESKESKENKENKESKNSKIKYNDIKWLTGC